MAEFDPYGTGVEDEEGYPVALPRFYAGDEEGYPAAPAPGGTMNAALPPTLPREEQRAADFAAYKLRNPDTETSRTIGNSFAWYPGDAPLPTREERQAMDDVDKGSISARRYLGMIRYRDAVARGESPMAAFNQNAPMLFGDNPSSFMKAMKGGGLTPPTNPSQIPVRDPVTGKLLGIELVDSGGKHRATMSIPKENDRMSVSDTLDRDDINERIRSLGRESTKIQSAIVADPYYLKMNPGEAAKMEQINSDIEELRGRRKEMSDRYRKGVQVPSEVRAAEPKARKAMGGYVIGKVYRGLRYLGGNINDEANSWESVKK